MDATTQATSGITLRDKLGYALGDVASCLFLGVIPPFLQMFYTDVLHLSAASITVLLLVLRIWDGINDPLLGTLIDRSPVGKHGKFRPYLRNFAVPVAFCSLLMFTKVPGLSQGQYLIYAYVTHFLYEFFYTLVNIPYGSMASVITDDGKERSQLSVYRSIGSGIGGLPAQLLMPLFVYSTSAAGHKYLDSGKLSASMAVLAVLGVTAFMFSFRMTKERLLPSPQAKDSGALKTIGSLLRNRPYLVVCFVSLLISGITFFSPAFNNYLFKEYFQKPELYTLVTIATYAPNVLLLPVLGKLVARFGKRNLCAAGAFLSALGNAVILLLRTQSPVVFLVFCFISGLGATFLTMQIWAMATDVIDYQELVSRERKEGTSYALFSFARKVGQTLAGSGSAFILGKIGYDEKNTLTAQPPGVTRGLYTYATLMPAIAFLLIFAALAFVYPLSKEREEDMRAVLRVRRAQEAGEVQA